MAIRSRPGEGLKAELVCAPSARVADSSLEVVFRNPYAADAAGHQHTSRT